MMKQTVPAASVVLVASLALGACGGGGNSVTTANAGATPALDYSYPLSRQVEVPTHAPIILHFSDSVSETDIPDSIHLYKEGEHTPVAVALKTASEGRALILNPVDRTTASRIALAPHSRYRVVIDGSSLIDTRTIVFHTKALEEGPKSEVASLQDMKLADIFPNGGKTEPMMDFSTLRLRFSQPLDQQTVTYGSAPATIALLDNKGRPVSAHLIVDGPYLTIDPEENLQAGASYTLQLESGAIKSTYGEPLVSDRTRPWSFTPQSSLPQPGSEPTVLVQKVADGGLSELTGNPVNVIPMNATLLGTHNEIPQSGDVVGTLADLTRYTEVTPLSIPHGTLLKGAGIAVNIGGKVYAGFDTGAVNIRFLSDASGYLFPNIYTTSPDAPRLVRLYMDVAISAENPTANAGITQNITHLELIGTAQTRDGVIDINAVGVVEPRILGLEHGYGTLSFRLQTYRDQTAAPTIAKDTTAPVLQSRIPADDTSLMLPGDPIVLNFSEPLNPKTLAGITLTRTDSARSVPTAIRWRLDGATLIIEPVSPLRYSTQSNRTSYQLALPAGITDLAGNAFDVPTFPPFEMPVKTDLAYNLNDVRDPASGADTSTGSTLPVRSPFVLGVYPGYPCVTDPATRDLANNDAGRCAGGHPGTISSYPFDDVPEDDHLPVMHLAANRPITVSFSKDMMPDSIRLGGSFSVNEVADDGTPGAAVAGTLDISPRQIIFWPAQPWKEGVLYRYTLGSNNDAQSSLATCDGSQALCGMQQALPLQTQLLGEKFICDKTTASPGDTLCYDDNTTDPSWNMPTVSSIRVQTLNPSDTGGGPDLSIFFRGAKASSNILQALRATPVSDLNANLVHDANHTVVERNDITLTGRPYYDPRDPDTSIHGYVHPYRTQLLEEPGPTEKDPYADPELDPGGMLPPPNSTKILSLDTRGKDMINGGLSLLINGANVGCGASEWVSGDPAYVGTYGIYPECPKEKFTYLLGALTAEITNIHQPGLGLQVKIWPTRVMTTSFLTVAHMATFASQSATLSGPQVMRMRYEEGADGRRNQPITGWIRPGPDGRPELFANVDLYLDAPWLSSNVSAPGTVHNQNSYPVSMTLSGPIQFLPDGRMVVTQKNVNAVDIIVSILASNATVFGEVALRIPAAGSRLQFVSEPIKRLH